MTSRIRHLTPADYPLVISVIDNWWGGRQMVGMLPRLFFEHFTDTSFAAEDDGKLAGFLTGFISQSRPGQAYIHFVGVDPAQRGAGLGRLLYEAFFRAARARGCILVRAVTSPANHGSVAFHQRMGFQLEPGDANADGIPVFSGYDGPGSDRVRFVKVLPGLDSRIREAVGGMDERVRRARLRYERAVFAGDPGPLAAADLELDAAEADLAVARGQIMHTRFLLRRDEDPDQAEGDPVELVLFERAAQLYRALGDTRGEAEALFWVGCFHQVARRDNAAAAPALERSLELASQADDKATMSEALRHLGIRAHAAGSLELARQRLEESTRLRRDIGLWPGVAANLIGLAYIAAGQGRRDDAVALLDEASALAEANDAPRILRSASHARAELSA